MTGELLHERWCAKGFCDADPAAATAAGFSETAHRTAHRSAPVTLDLSTVIYPLRPLGPIVAWLERQVAPWHTVTYLRYRPIDDTDPRQITSWPLPTIYNLAQTLDRIVGRTPPPEHAPDYGREDPEEAGLPVPPYVEGYQVGPRLRAGSARNVPSRFTERPRPGRAVGSRA